MTRISIDYGELKNPPELRRCPGKARAYESDDEVLWVEVANAEIVTAQNDEFSTRAIIRKRFYRFEPLQEE